jgi:phosphoribosylamine--glycine ligase
MKILLVGNGGRENAIGEGIFNSISFTKTKSVLYSTLGSPGLNNISTPIDINPTNITELIKFGVKEKIDFTVVGPEIPLSMGIVNEFEKNNLKIFGPTKEASEIESSKAFAKDLMKKLNIPTADFKIFDGSNKKEVDNYLIKSKFPIVIKADGLAAGKGVIIANNIDEARKTVKEITEDKIFGESGNKIIIEEFLTGFELSLFVITDGHDYVLLPFSQDHKKIGDGDTGKNTGGMGAYAPADKLIDKEILEDIKNNIIEPTLKGMNDSGRIYKGCLYCGLMITNNKKPFVIEFNCRFGDPETQAVIPLIKSDFLELLIASYGSNIINYIPEFHESFTCCVILASNGYPDKFDKGKKIKGLENISDDCLIFHSGTRFTDNLDIITNGGRVLSVVTKSSSIEDAILKCYQNVDKIKFENKYFRKDIGNKYFKLLALEDNNKT